MGQKIKQSESGNIGKNIREIRVARGIGQTELVRLLDLQGIPITRECLVKIERKRPITERIAYKKSILQNSSRTVAFHFHSL